MQSNFTAWLQALHIKLNPEILDDELPDKFAEWIDSFTAQDMVELADEYSNQLK